MLPGFFFLFHYRYLCYYALARFGCGGQYEVDACRDAATGFVAAVPGGLSTEGFGLVEYVAVYVGNLDVRVVH